MGLATVGLAIVLAKTGKNLAPDVPKLITPPSVVDDLVLPPPDIPNVIPRPLRDDPARLFDDVRPEDWEVTVKDPQLLSALPANADEYRNVYGGFADDGTETKLARFNRRVEAGERSNRASSRGDWSTESGRQRATR